MITSAPKSPSRAAAAGPASHCERSSTRSPRSGPHPPAASDGPGASTRAPGLDPLDRRPHGLGVLAEPRGASRARGRRPREHRHGARERGTPRPVADVRRQDGLARLHVRVRDDVVGRADRGARHAGRREAGLDVGVVVPGDPGTRPARRRPARFCETRGGSGEARILAGRRAPRSPRRGGRTAGRPRRRPRSIRRRASGRRWPGPRWATRCRGARPPPRSGRGGRPPLPASAARSGRGRVHDLPAAAAPGVEDRHQEPARAVDARSSSRPAAP